MKIINAKILDPTHLELNQPISVQPGTYIQINAYALDSHKLA